MFGIRIYTRVSNPIYQVQNYEKGGKDNPGDLVYFTDAVHTGRPRSSHQLTSILIVTLETADETKDGGVPGDQG